MMIVIFALIPSIFMAIWNSGVQKFVYTSGDFRLMEEFYSSSHSFSDYLHFVTKDGRLLTILSYGLGAFLPVMLISYIVGGTCEGIVACVRRQEIAEGFLVTGMLFALILPPTIPYWMVAFGVATGVILSKEIFGGTGMNILNPAICCRVILFFTFPTQMTGTVWAGTNVRDLRQSLVKMNREAKVHPPDGYSGATPLARFNVPFDIKRIHVAAIGAHEGKDLDSSSYLVIKSQYEKWQSTNAPGLNLQGLNHDQLKAFVTDPLERGGLNLPPENFDDATIFSRLRYEKGIDTDLNFFFGNKLGSFGETSAFACLLGAIILIISGVGSWRIMCATLSGAFLTAYLFQISALYFGPDGGVWNPATFAFPAYRHLIIGGLAFGAVFMATDPVTACSLKLAQWIYGFFIGFIAMVIREINPAYPEGVMLAILIGNVFASLIDHGVALYYRRFARGTV
jgi:Na+-transporting NADH:ubiquinone oxidoreductase subunit B